MNKAQTRTFCQLFPSHKKQLLAFYSFWVFSRSKIMTLFPTLSYTWSLKKYPFRGGASPYRPSVGRIPREPFSSLDPVVSLEQIQPSGPGDQNDLHYRIREMSGASSIWLGDSDPERRIDNQSSIQYYSICCTSHPGAINVMLINFRVFFWEFAIDRFSFNPNEWSGIFLNKGAQSKTIKGVIAKTKQIQRDTCYEY